MSKDTMMEFNCSDKRAYSNFQLLSSTLVLQVPR